MRQQQGRRQQTGWQQAASTAPLLQKLQDWPGTNLWSVVAAAKSPDFTEWHQSTSPNPTGPSPLYTSTVIAHTRCVRACHDHACCHDDSPASRHHLRHHSSHHHSQSQRVSPAADDSGMKVLCKNRQVSMALAEGTPVDTRAVMYDTFTSVLHCWQQQQQQQHMQAGGRAPCCGQLIVGKTWQILGIASVHAQARVQS